ncbi:MAG: DUF4845 domain-containing protein [Betaproteobacteria bacterium]|nr:DUF4845 domain-containing protein [Betaproteobacteria bacterium]
MRKEQGISFLGFIMLAVLVAAAALVGFKVTPVYVEYFSIKKMLSTTVMEAKDLQPSEIRRVFERKLATEYIESVNSTDLDIGKESGQLVISVSYIKKIPLVSNVSLYFEFDASARR